MHVDAACGTDAVLGNLPLFYPFLVNDPGEGAQAKRRAHATIIDLQLPTNDGAAIHITPVESAAASLGLTPK